VFLFVAAQEKSSGSPFLFSSQHSRGEMVLYAPFDKPWVPFVGVFVYLCVIGLVNRWMKERKPYELKTLLTIHNLFLTALSLYMAVGLTYRVIHIAMNYGLFSLYCGASVEEDDKLMFWTNIFYISKYYELLDTLFVVLRKKPLSFLHVWHHCSVVFVCYLGNYQEIVMGWITCFQNSLIHVLMYYYYSLQSMGRRDVWWRRYLTTLQIIQFVIDIVTSVFFPYFYFVGIPCRGKLEAWLVANVTGFSFFLLFLDFYSQNYKQESGKQKKERKTE
jgi:hypothetical protein